MAQTPEVRNLQQLIDDAGSAVDLLRNNSYGLPDFGYALTPFEITNWRDEQRSWMQRVGLMELSYFMTEMHLRGPEVIQFLKQVTANKLDPFRVMRAKQLIFVGPDGNLLSDGICFHEEDDFFRIVGLSPVVDDWLLFNAARSELDFTVERKTLKPPRDVFRLQLQGPNALPLVTELAGGELEEISFFGIGELQIGGKTVRALRHGMAGAAGFEIYGPWADQQAVRDAISSVGEQYGLRTVGDAAYRSTSQESGWLAEPLPAVYSGEDLRPFRETIDSSNYAAFASLGGSFVSKRIEDYYVDPIEAGYKPFVDWDRDFIGSEPLKAKPDTDRRVKVTLEWNDDDVVSVIASSLFGQGPGARYIGLPTPSNSFYTQDQLLSAGEHAGVSSWASYTANARRVLSIALVDPELAEPGTELTLQWGEPDSTRLPVDANEMREIRVTVAHSPYFEKLIKTSAPK